jgi:hydroxymethylpyrimidine/phosphomethylpyrimidine kinase
MKKKSSIPVVLTIAGSDSGGGAGIQADLKTFIAHGVYGVSVITAITAQNSQRVKHIFPLEAQIVEAQLEALLEDYCISAVKIGMLYRADIIRTVAQALVNYSGFIVLDPIINASAGQPLLEEDALAVMQKELFPIISLLTPNADEAALLYGKSFSAPTEVPRVLARLARFCPQAAILLKGGHLAHSAEPFTQATDWLLYQGRLQSFTGAYLANKSLHGTGCTLASAIAARVAQGFSLPKAVELAKEYLYLAISRSYQGVGMGRTPLNHLANFTDDSI